MASLAPVSRLPDLVPTAGRMKQPLQETVGCFSCGAQLHRGLYLRGHFCRLAVDTSQLRVDWRSLPFAPTSMLHGVCAFSLTTVPSLPIRFSLPLSTSSHRQIPTSPLSFLVLLAHNQLLTFVNAVVTLFLSLIILSFVLLPKALVVYCFLLLCTSLDGGTILRSTVTGDLSTYCLH